MNNYSLMIVDVGLVSSRNARGREKRKLAGGASRRESDSKSCAQDRSIGWRPSFAMRILRVTAQTTKAAEDSLPGVTCLTHRVRRALFQCRVRVRKERPIQTLPRFHRPLLVDEET